MYVCMYVCMYVISMSVCYASAHAYCPGSGRVRVMEFGSLRVLVRARFSNLGAVYAESRIFPRTYTGVYPDHRVERSNLSACSAGSICS